MGVITGGPSAIALADLNDVSIVSPLNGQYLRYNSGISEWQNAYIDSDIYDFLDANMSGSNGISITYTPGPNTIGIALSLTANGDASGTVSSGNLPLTLATVNGNVGSFGTATSVPTFTVNGKGLITSATDTPIALTASQTTSGTFADARISESSVTQHQAALTILETQITDGSILARVAANETITGTWQFNNAVTGVDPSTASQLATKQYVDNLVTGLDMKQSARAATTTDITLSGPQTIDGVSIIAGDRVLVKDQSAAATNGIYVAAAGAWARSPDADGSPSQEVSSGMYLFIQEGTVNADTGWVLATSNPIILGTTPLTFVQFTGLGQITAGAGLTKSGSTLNINTASSSRIVINTDDIDLATVSDAGTGTFLKLTRDSYGRISGTTAVVASDITGLVNSTYVNITGDNMTGNLTITGGTTQTGGEDTLTLISSNPSTIAATITGSSLGHTEIMGGGQAGSSYRGAEIDLFGGNHASTPGVMVFRTGTATGGTAQTERMRIAGTGEVLIGTSTVTSGVPLDVSTNSNSNTTLRMLNGNTGTSAATRLQAASDVGNISVQAGSSTYTGSAITGGGAGGGVYTTAGLTNGLAIGTTAGPLKFFAGSTSAERGRFDGANFLIGTTSAAGPLTVMAPGTTGSATVLASFSTGADNPTGTVGTESRLHLAAGAGISRSVYIGGLNVGGANNEQAMTFAVSPPTAVPAEVMRLGRFGLMIGNTNGATPLEVTADSSARAITIRGRSSDNVSSLNFYSNDGATNYSQIQGRVNGDTRYSATTNSGFHAFFTGASLTERMRINNDALLTISHGSSGGLQLSNVDNATGTVLDWYEESTFTPVVAFGGASVGVTYTSRVGSFQRIGKVLNYWIVVVLSNKGSSTGAVTITGLPYTANATHTTIGACDFGAGSVTGLTGKAMSFVTANTSAAALFQSSATGRVSITDAAITNTTTFIISGSYFVA